MWARAAGRMVSLGGHVLESIGRARFRNSQHRERATWLQELCARACDLHGFRVELEGKIPPGPSVIVANHLSYIDPLILGSLMGCVPLAKAEVASWPIVGTSAQALGVLFVRRGDPWSGARALRACLRSLEAGVPVLGFPEGTTSDGTGVLPFHRGLFGLARLAQVPVVPLALSYDCPDAAWVGESWFLPHYVRTAMRPETHAVVRVGEPILPSLPPDELAAFTRSRFLELRP